MTYREVSLGAGILPATGDGSADDGGDGVLAAGAGQVAVGSVGDGGGCRADEAALVHGMVDDGILDGAGDRRVPLELKRHGSWRSNRHLVAGGVWRGGEGVRISLLHNCVVGCGVQCGCDCRGCAGPTLCLQWG